ncbi:MAG: winged helix DNA-binding domain-containing protein [archaeon GB-1867-035]|nr:winged helix DNA-binding domain-containing protein [Candidatus Culexmicrobium profundum]
MALESISVNEARKLIVKKQRLPPSFRGKGKEEVVEVVRSIAGVQYDPLPVIMQAQYLTLWNRVKNFRPEFLDELLYKERKLIEFVLIRQALHIVPVDELPYYYQAVQRVFRRGWIQRSINKQSMEELQEIVKVIREKGTVSIKDFPYTKLRALFYMGKIAIAKREVGMFQMPHYSLLNTLHPQINLEEVEEDEAARWLVLRTVSAFGISPSSHIAYWIGYKVKETENILRELEEEGEVRRVKIEGLRKTQWIRSKDLERIGSIKREEFISLLTPMDNLTRDRKWLEELFGYTFKIEYFQKKGMRWQVSVLMNYEFLGFINPKMDRKNKTFIIKEVNITRKIEEDKWEKILKRIEEFAKFHKAEKIKVTDKRNRDVIKTLEKLGYESVNNYLIYKL